MARSFVAMVPELVLVRNPLEIAERGWQHRGMVWLPSEMVLNADLCAEADVPHSWDVTSDSLAAWLAQQLEASQLVLIKSDHRLIPAQASWSITQLVAQSCLDAAFPLRIQNAQHAAWVMHHSDSLAFAQGFCQTRLTGRLVD
jgi:5-(aminomethyl)-3-furanmethanol phosphate kinase